MRTLGMFLAVIVTAVASFATTLEQLTVDDMIQKSTEIVRAKVSSKSAFTKGNMIYTQYRLDVLQQWKGATATKVDIVVPGGVAGHLRQTFSGAPEIELNQEYVFFLWTGSNGLTQIIGLSQGAFELNAGTDGVTYANRPQLNAHVVSSNGKQASSGAIRLTLKELVAQIESGLPNRR